MNEEPHAITDDEPSGEPAQEHVVIRRKRVKTIITSVDFDDILREFELWNYIYDLRDSSNQEFEFETTPDYKQRKQIYEVTSSIRVINKLRKWLIINNFKFIVD